MGHKSPVLSLTLFFPNFGKRTLRRIILGFIPVGLSNQGTSPLLYIRDSVSNHRYLVDTGTTISIFPHTSLQPSSNLSLVSATGSAIRSWGKRHIVLHFGLHRFVWPFRLASVDRPIICADFLKAYKLLVDVARHRLLFASTLQPLELPSVSSIPDSAIYTAPLCVPNEYRKILEDFPEITHTDLKNKKTQHSTQHHIVTTGPPVFVKARRLDAEKLEIATMEEAGIIRRSSSSWSSPLHMVLKPDGTWRTCGDYRCLNNVTKPDRYPVPNVQDLSSCLSEYTVFSKLDLEKGYYQVPMSPEDVNKTAVVTPFGLWEFLKMPFGLRNAGQTFQRLMDQNCAGLTFTFVYLDDVLVSSPDDPSHIQHLRHILQQFKEYGLVINLKKCAFGLSEISFLGHKVTSSGISPLQKHSQAVKEYLRPSDRLEVQRFLGLINFYRRFISGAAKILKPLTDSLAGTSRIFQWTAEMDSAFHQAKRALVTASLLVHPLPSTTLALAVDASATHVGAVLQQFVDKSLAHLAFFSRKLSETEMRYSTFDRELLAAFFAIRHFRFLLEAREFQLWTDHKPLCSAINRVSPPWSARQQRHLSYITEFTSNLRHVPGAENIVADALSRPPTTTPSLIGAVSPPPVVDLKVLAEQQTTCPSIQDLSVSSNLNLKQVSMEGVMVHCDLSTETPRPLVSQPSRRGTSARRVAGVRPRSNAVWFSTPFAQHCACGHRCRKVCSGYS